MNEKFRKAVGNSIYEALLELQQNPEGLRYDGKLVAITGTPTYMQIAHLLCHGLLTGDGEMYWKGNTSMIAQANATLEVLKKELNREQMSPDTDEDYVKDIKEMIDHLNGWLEN